MTAVILQNRWQVVDVGGAPHLLYYGVRNPPRHREQLQPIPRELAAVRELGYWRPPAILARLTADLGITPAEVEASTDELYPGLAEWAELTNSERGS